jgi:putative transposase
MSYSVYTKQESTAYLKEIEARALNYAQQNLKKAFTNFFKGWRKGVGYPAYKHKTTEGSFQSDDIQVIGRKLKVPKCPGLIPFRNYAEIDFSTLKTKTITISRTSNFKYYASILCENAADVTLPKTGVTIGIDLGVTTAITLSDGRKIDRQSIQTQKMYFQGNRNGEDPRVAKLREKISFFQKKLAKAGEWTEKTFTGKDGKQHTKRVLVQETGNYRRYKAKVAALTEKLYNMRSNYINNTAKYVVKEADVICMEDLIIQNGCEHHGMLADDAAKTTHQNRTSHRNIAEASMGMLATKIKSMAIMYGKTVIEVNPAYTSRTCHCCGHLLTEPLATTIRDWTCPKCHTHHDRDVNAAKNILQKGLDKMNKNC